MKKSVILLSALFCLLAVSRGAPAEGRILRGGVIPLLTPVGETAAPDGEADDEETIFSEDDETGDAAGAEDIAEGQETALHFRAGETKYLRFVPGKTDGYAFVSFDAGGECDPACWLCDADMNIIAGSDDEAGSVHFRAAGLLQKGKVYYLACGITGETEGSYSVRLERASGLMSAEAADVPDEIRKNMKLSVRAAATSGTKLSYQWYRAEGMPEEDEGTGGAAWEIMEKQKKASVTVASPAAGAGYCCRVSDGLGNEKTVYFLLDEGGITVYTGGPFDRREDPETGGAEEADAGDEDGGEDPEDEE